MNIDLLADKENFNLERIYQSGEQSRIDQIECKIMGIRRAKSTQDIPRPTFEGKENDIQWVELSGCQYSIDEGELKSWLEM